MSLTSYRAAPPRVRPYDQSVTREAVCADEVGGGWSVLLGLISSALGRPGSDRLSRVLRRSTMGAGGFHGRVRDGIGCFSPR
jgi:hypothetical protein